MQQDILLLTGWGATCKVWQPLIAQFNSHYRIQCPNPSWLKEGKLSNTSDRFTGYINSVAENMQENTSILAWSYGGLIATRLAYKFPNLVKQIIFIASTPKFIGDSHGPGIDAAWFQQFKKNFHAQPSTTFKRFISLQAKGDKNARSLIKQLHQYCSLEDYNLNECKLALNYLAELNLLTELQASTCECCFVHGNQDAVVPIAAVQAIAELLDVKLYEIETAGHAPHISHPEAVQAILNTRLN